MKPCNPIGKNYNMNSTQLDPTFIIVAAKELNTVDPTPPPKLQLFILEL